MFGRFAPLYESILSLGSSNFDHILGLIFDSFYLYGGYYYFTAIFFFIPLVFCLLFYFAFKYPYTRLWHWTTLLVVVSIIVAVSTAGTASLQIFATADPNLHRALSGSQEYEDFAYRLIFKLSIYNAILATLVFIGSSLLFKNFSKIHMHLPFVLKK